MHAGKQKALINRRPNVDCAFPLASDVAHSCDFSSQLTSNEGLHTSSLDIDRPACHICGTKRQRNLIISYIKKKHQSIEDYLINPLSGDRHVICFRCDSLNLSVDDLRYMKDRYFLSGFMGRYKDLKQKMAANKHKRNMGGD